MASGRDRILVVESDPVAADLIGRQALQAVGYQVGLVGDATSALTRAMQWQPSLMLVDVNLNDLSGKDLLVALKSQGLTAPVVLLARKGQEADIIQSFRLGAADYLLMPVREAEVVAAVERVLKQVHEREERERLALQLQSTNQELQLRVRELTTLFAVGKAVTSTTDLKILLSKILAGGVSVTQADLGWFLMRNDPRNPFMLVAERNLPASMGIRVGQAWDDGLSKLVAMSGEALSIHGEPLKRFKISALGQSALVAPISTQQRNRTTVVGLLTMMRRQPAAFSNSEQHLLEALADYASIALVNANVIRSAEERSRALRSAAELAHLGEKINANRLMALRSQVEGTLAGVKAAFAQPFTDSRDGVLQEALSVLKCRAEEAEPVLITMPARLVPLDMAEALRQALERASSRIQHAGLRLRGPIPGEPSRAQAEPALIGVALDSVLDEVLRRCPHGGELAFRLEQVGNQYAHLALFLPGVHLNADETRQLQDPATRMANRGQLNGLGANLSLVKEIINHLGGGLWVNDPPDQGIILSIRLPLAR